MRLYSFPGFNIYSFILLLVNFCAFWEKEVDKCVLIQPPFWKILAFFPSTSELLEKRGRFYMIALIENQRESIDKWLEIMSLIRRRLWYLCLYLYIPSLCSNHFSCFSLEMNSFHHFPPFPH